MLAMFEVGSEVVGVSIMEICQCIVVVLDNSSLT